MTTAGFLSKRYPHRALTACRCRCVPWPATDDLNAACRL